MRTKPAAVALAATGLALSLAATLGLSSTAGAAVDDQKAAASTTTAKQALTAAQGVITPRGKPSHDVTLALRDLFEAQADLKGADLKAAQTILSRPTDPDDDDYYGPGVTVETECSLVCLHWVETGENAATPGYAAEVLETMDMVHTAYDEAGYKNPLPDEGQGGSTKTDVYLAEISDYAYGYCSTDMTEYNGEDYSVYTYCVLDDDYAEFPPLTPTENMQVTAAHEYFHAVQGAYDWSEDGWLIENTATWAEDELFDDVNDNLNYLPYGQLGDPSVTGSPYDGPWFPLDGAAGLNIYGNWIFFRFLTENFSAEEGGMPVLMRKIWENADSTNGAQNDQYSLQAVSNALDDVGVPFPTAYTSFALANRDPGTYYEEGIENSYPTPPLSFKPVTLTPKKRKTSWGNLKQDHLTNDTVRFMPGTKMKQSGWKLKVQVDMAPENRGSLAMVTVYYKDGEAGVKQIGLNGQGDGSTKVPFSKSEVSYVELTMVNASERTSCWVAESGVPYSCYGIPMDDRMKAEFRGVASK